MARAIEILYKQKIQFFIHFCLSTALSQYRSPISTLYVFIYIPTIFNPSQNISLFLLSISYLSTFSGVCHCCNVCSKCLTLNCPLGISKVFMNLESWEPFDWFHGILFICYTSLHSGLHVQNSLWHNRRETNPCTCTSIHLDKDIYIYMMQLNHDRETYLWNSQRSTTDAIAPLPPSNPAWL